MKTAVSANDLACLALQELRTLPGAEDVTSAHVERGDNTWALVVSARAGADLGRVQKAVREAERRLGQRYRLKRE
jgi:hypothetical protein